MFSIMMLGLLIGMRHAFEADHMAAVASLASRHTTVREAVWQGSVWGLGHTLTLFLFGSLVLVMGWVIAESLACYLELAVGAMLLLLGLDVLRQIIRQRVHYHIHSHAPGGQHFHAHCHAGEQTTHASSSHQHSHPQRFPVRALLVGMMHGMAGSAALILLTLETVGSAWTGLLYIILFGFGSVLGMAILSAVIAIPLRYSSRGLTVMHNGLQLLIGVSTVVIGGNLIYQVAVLQ